MKQKQPSATLKRIAKYIANEPWGFEALQILSDWDKMLEHTEGSNGKMENVELADAVYWLSANCHTGQFCGLYAAGCQTLYTPSCSAHGPDGDIAEEIYQEIEPLIMRQDT